MAAMRGSRFRRSLQDLRGLSEGDRDEKVEILQRYLADLGYLTLGEKTMTGSPETSERVATAGRFDEATTAALLHYQRFFKLPPTGVLDDATVRLMKLPRCGNRDVLLRSQEKAIQANPWGKNDLSFCTQLPSAASEPDMDTSQKCAAAFQAAFSIWPNEAAIPMRFHAAANNETCDISISFGGPQCGGDACTDCPPDGNPLQMLYDVSEQWSPNAPANWPPLDIIAFACHEVGHALGLCRHSANPDAIMYPIIPNLKRHLLSTGEDNDVDRIRAIYQAR